MTDLGRVARRAWLDAIERTRPLRPNRDKLGSWDSIGEAEREEWRAVAAAVVAAHSALSTRTTT